MVLPEERDIEVCTKELENTVECLSTGWLSMSESDTALAVEFESLKNRLLLCDNPNLSTISS